MMKTNETNESETHVAYYFVSYFFVTQKNPFPGFGRAFVLSNDGVLDIKGFESHIKASNGFDGVTVLSFQAISKEQYEVGCQSDE